jgi:hypothetical protein
MHVDYSSHPVVCEDVFQVSGKGNGLTAGGDWDGWCIPSHPSHEHQDLLHINTRIY